MSVNVLRQLIRVAVTKGDDETEVAVYSADLVSFDPSLKKSKNEDIDELLDEVEFDEDWDRTKRGERIDDLI